MKIDEKLEKLLKIAKHIKHIKNGNYSETDITFINLFTFLEKQQPVMSGSGFFENITSAASKVFTFLRTVPSEKFKENIDKLDVGSSALESVNSNIIMYFFKCFLDIDNSYTIEKIEELLSGKTELIIKKANLEEFFKMYDKNNNLKNLINVLKLSSINSDLVIAYKNNGLFSTSTSLSNKIIKKLQTALDNYKNAIDKLYEPKLYKFNENNVTNNQSGGDDEVPPSEEMNSEEMNQDNNSNNKITLELQIDESKNMPIIQENLDNIYNTLLLDIFNTFFVLKQHLYSDFFKKINDKKLTMDDKIFNDLEFKIIEPREEESIRATRGDSTYREMPNTKDFDDNMSPRPEGEIESEEEQGEEVQIEETKEQDEQEEPGEKQPKEEQPGEEPKEEQPGEEPKEEQLKEEQSQGEQRQEKPTELLGGKKYTKNRRNYYLRNGKKYYVRQTKKYKRKRTRKVD